MKKQSDWMRGLLYGEHLGLVEAQKAYEVHVMNDLDDFDKGLLDYIHHATHRLGEQNK